MADATATFALNLDANVGAASAAAGNLDLLQTAIQSDIKELNALETAMKQVNKGGEVDIATFRAMQERANELKTSISKNQQEFVKLGGSFKQTAGAENMLMSSNGMLNENVKKVLGPLGEKGDRLLAIKGLLGTSGLAAAGFAVAVVALAAVVAAAAVAIGQLVLKMAEYALTVSDAALKSQIMLEGMTGSAAAAGALEASINRVSAKSTQGRDAIAKLAQELYKSGKRGAELEKAMLDASYAADGLGKNPSPELIRRRMANLDVQALKFKQHVADIFSGQSTRTAVEKFEMGLASVLDMFDTSSASGKALQAIVSSMLNPLFNAATAAAPYVKAMFKGFVVGALVVRIAVLALRNELQSWFGDMDIGVGKMEGMKIAFYAGVVIAGLVVVALGAIAVAAVLVAAAFGIAALAVGLFMLPFAIGFGIIVIAVLAVVAVAGLLVYAIYKAGEALVQWASDGIAAAQSLITGLVSGITSGAGMVYDAIKSLASGAISTLMGALDAHSPSKKFLAIGNIGIAGGVEAGVEAGKQGVNAAVDDLVSMPSSRAASPDVPALAAGGAAGASGGRPKVSLGPLVVNVLTQEQASAVRQFYDDLCGTLEEAGAAAGVDFEFEGAPA